MKYRIREHHGKFHAQICNRRLFRSIFKYKEAEEWKWLDCNNIGQGYWRSTHYSSPSRSGWKDTLQEVKDQINIWEKPDRIHLMTD